MKQESRKIYTVVEVISGVADAVYPFKHLKNAQQFFKNLKKKHNSDENDIQIFESSISK
ncbi:MAG: hypothetical protein AAB533_03150 [Patescibacteria group bacterium]